MVLRRMIGGKLISPVKAGLSVAAAIAAVITAYFFFYSVPVGSIWLEAEYFFFQKPQWVVVEDVNFSYSKGIMTKEEGFDAVGAFETQEAGTYNLWIKYFGNYGKADLALWKRAYTNIYGYIDYFGSEKPMELKVNVDGSIGKVITEEGTHRYRWARVEGLSLKKGSHTVRLSKAAGGAGGVTIDSVLITADLAYHPGRVEALPRQVSEYFGPFLILAFPAAILLAARRWGRSDDTRAEKWETRGGPHNSGPFSNVIFSHIKEGLTRRHSGYLLGSVAVCSMLSVMWIDTDGGFWIWLSQNPDFNFLNIYSSGHGEALHHRYVYQPPVAMMLIGLRQVFSLFGAMDGITPLSLILSKLVVFPFMIGTGFVLYRLEGERAVALWALNSLVIFTAAANSMYFALAFLLSLLLYAIKEGKPFHGALALGCALAYMPATALLVPPYLLMLRGLKLTQLVKTLLLVFVPGFVVLLPYRLADPAGLDIRMMGAGIATWMEMHLGLKMGGVGVTTFLYGALLAFIWLERLKADYLTVTAVFALAALIYMHIGAPHYLAWTAAFQPFIIAWACRLRQEVFYSIYITAFMVWGSFYLNTGGALDRAGETGFFPYYIFYTWPFDVYRFLRTFYGKIDYFSRADLEALTHSMSAGVSLVMALLVLYGFLKQRRENGEES